MISHSGSRKKNFGNKELLCPHCYAKNVVTAYCCLSCFKVMDPPMKIPLWKRTVYSNRTVVLFCVFLCMSSVIFVKRWLYRVEMHLQTMHEENARYHAFMEKVIIQKIKVDQTLMKQGQPPLNP